MRILIYSINYFPELTGIGKYTGEMSEWLASRGHEVRVVTAPPYYPRWRVGGGYSDWKYRGEAINGVRIFRCPLWVPQKPSGLKRILHLASFALSSFPVMFLQLFWKPNVVFVVEPSFFCTPGAWLVSRLSGAKAWLHVQDFEVDAAFDMGILSRGALGNMVLALDAFVMRRFDYVSTISKKMMERLGEKGVGSEKRILFPNWVDVESIFPVESSHMRDALGVGKEEIVCLYSGNMGEKQGLDILIEAARLLVHETAIRFVICGNGGERERLFALAKDLPNVSWLPLQPVDKLNDLLNMADIHLLPQRGDVADLVMPSKLTGMLASGKPVIATARQNTEVAEVVSGCGRIVEPGDASGLAHAILDLSGKAELRKAMGESGRLHARKNLACDAVLSRLEAVMKLDCSAGRA
ncbi:MAG: glycosyltransferase WbuB [Burkholderiales bacterium]|nr:glycosyltransferase WbuB [Burkholderiales bacterium]